MHYKIQYASMALKDLDEIWDYITKELMNPSAAENTINGIMDIIDNLTDFPETGAKLIFDNGLDSGYRYVLYKNYMAFYHIQAGCVYIDRIMYGRRDYMKELFENEKEQ